MARAHPRRRDAPSTRSRGARAGALRRCCSAGPARRAHTSRPHANQPRRHALGWVDRRCVCLGRCCRFPSRTAASARAERGPGHGAPPRNRPSVARGCRALRRAHTPSSVSTMGLGVGSSRSMCSGRSSASVPTTLRRGAGGRAGGASGSGSSATSSALRVLSRFFWLPLVEVWTPNDGSAGAGATRATHQAPMLSFRHAVCRLGFRRITS
jgi:hypothetical protein